MAVEIAKPPAPAKGTRVGAKPSEAEAPKTAGTGTQVSPAPDTAPSPSESEETKRKTIESLSLKDLRKHPEFARANEIEINAGVQRALQKRDQEARRKELESLPAEERYVQIGRQSEAEKVRAEFVQGMYAEFQNQATAPLTDKFDEELLTGLTNRANVGEFISGVYEEAFKAGFEAAKKDKETIAAMEAEIRNKERKGEASPRSAPQGTETGVGTTIADVRGMSAKEFEKFEQDNPELFKAAFAKGIRTR